MFEKWECHTLVVGGGLAGLACALTLQDAGVDWLLIEKNDTVGGRVRTHTTEDGFLIDRGFQVLNTAYPALHRWIDLQELQLGEFASGADVFLNGKFHRVGDPLRNPSDLFPTLAAPVGSLKDKINILRLVWFCSKPQNFQAVDKMTTEEFLLHFGFSQSMIERFFRPFFGGVFLEEELLTSAGKFVTLFSYFSRGRAALPARGMQALPELMASKLPPERLKLGVTGESLKEGAVFTESSQIKARNVVLAGWDVQHRLLQQPLPETHSAYTVSFARPRSPEKGKSYLKLNGSPKGVVQTVAVNSAAQPSYAPADFDLMAVSTRREASVGQIKEDLMAWFGPAVKEWTHLRTDHIQHALPQEWASFSPQLVQSIQGVKVLCCGDHTETGSIQGALTSGRKAALAARSS